MLVSDGISVLAVAQYRISRSGATAQRKPQGQSSLASFAAQLRRRVRNSFD